MTWESRCSVGMRVIAARLTSFSLWIRYSISALIVIDLSLYSRPSAASSGSRAMPPSSSSTSQMTPAGAKPARRARATAPPAWPARLGAGREDVPGAREVVRARGRVDQRPDGHRAVVGGGPGGHAATRVHAH